MILACDASTSSSTRAGATPSPSRSRSPRSPMPSASCCLAGAVSTTTQRHGREWCGAGAVHAASTKPSSASRGTGSSTNARIDRRASRNAGTRLTRRLRCDRAAVTGRGPRPGGRTSSRDGALAEPRRVEAADDRDRHARRLAHHQLGGGGDLVGDRHLGDLELAAERVVGAAEVDDGGEAGDADGDVGESLAPRAAEGVGDRRHRRRRRGWRGARRGCGGPSGRCRRGAARPSRRRRSTGRRRRSRTRTRAGSR